MYLNQWFTSGLRSNLSTLLRCQYLNRFVIRESVALLLSGFVVFLCVNLQVCDSFIDMQLKIQLDNIFQDLYPPRIVFRNTASGSYYSLLVIMAKCFLKYKSRTHMISRHQSPLMLPQAFPNRRIQLVAFPRANSHKFLI